jgi:hypothetical protein
LFSPQENPQTFFFDRRMKTTDYRHPLIAEFPRRIVSTEYGITWTTDRAEQADFMRCKPIGCTDGPEL